MNSIAVLRRALLIAASVAAGLILSSATNAATLTLDPSSPIDGKTWTMTPSDFLHSAYYTPNPTPQDSDSIAAFLETWFSLSSTPTAVSQVDSYSEGTGTLDYTNSAGFNVIGIHIGLGEFAFLYDHAIAHFVFTVSSNNISNLRTYCSLGDCTGNNGGGSGGGLATPLPSALVLFGTALLGLIPLARRRRRTA